MPGTGRPGTGRSGERAAGAVRTGLAGPLRLLPLAREAGERGKTRKRAAMYADPDWQAYIEKNAEHGYLIKQESKLMSPASFAPLRR